MREFMFSYLKIYIGALYVVSNWNKTDNHVFMLRINDSTIIKVR